QIHPAVSCRNLSPNRANSRHFPPFLRQITLSLQHNPRFEVYSIRRIFGSVMVAGGNLDMLMPRRLASARLALAIAALPALAARADDFATVTTRVQSNLLSVAPSTSTVQGYINSIQADGHWTDIDYSSTAQTNWSPLTHVQRM